MSNFLSMYRGVLLIDMEFLAPDSECQESVCLVATELLSGRTISVWQDELRKLKAPPFPIDEHHLVVSFNAAAELDCFIELDWEMPKRILDPYAEFRRTKSGTKSPGSSLLAAMEYYGLPSITKEAKDKGRQLVLKGSWTAKERNAVLAYCKTDVDALAMLLPAMIDRGHITEETLPGALIRGRYMAAVASMQRRGIPLDAPYLDRFKKQWPSILPKLVRDVDKQYCVYDGVSFRENKFAALLTRKGVDWPRLETGRLQMDKDTFKSMAKLYPYFENLRQLRKTMAQCKTLQLKTGKDGRSRCPLFPFSSQTGRNQPGSASFIFGSPSWLRGLIRPARGMALAYCDWVQQELAIAACLSGDRAMMNAYLTGDFYMATAIAAGAAPPWATKATHKEIRDLFKIVCLGVQYGMTEWGIARRLGGSVAKGAELLALHQRAFPVFWKWIEDITESGMLNGRLATPFDWQVAAGEDPNPRSLQNFLMQGSGGDMMRIACSLLTEQGIHVCAPVHDALLIESPIGEIDEVVAHTQRVMQQAAAHVLGVPGFDVRSDAQIVRYPDRYWDPKLPTDGSDMWTKICHLAEVQP